MMRLVRTLYRERMTRRNLWGTGWRCSRHPRLPFWTFIVRKEFWQISRELRARKSGLMLKSTWEDLTHNKSQWLQRAFTQLFLPINLVKPIMWSQHSLHIYTCNVFWINLALWPQLSEPLVKTHERMMLEGVSIWITLALILNSVIRPAAARDFSLVGYLPEWRHEGADFDRLAKHLSHLILFSAEVWVVKWIWVKICFVEIGDSKRRHRRPWPTAQVLCLSIIWLGTLKH